MRSIRDGVVGAWMSLASSGARVCAVDFFLLVASVCFGYALRLSIVVDPYFYPGLITSCVVFPLCVIVALRACGVYKVYWPQAGAAEYARLTRGYIYGCALFLAVTLFSGAIEMPRISLAITIMGGLIFMSSARSVWRLAELSRTVSRERPADAKRALIIGAGEAGAYIARDLAMRSDDIVPLGFIDDDPNKKGKIIAGLSVIGDDRALPIVAQQMRADLALIAIPSAAGSSVKKYLDALAGLGVDVRVLPSMRELAGGAVSMASMRPVSLADLLRRDQISLDEEGIDKVIMGRTVLITGAGGSIGTELCLQIARFSPDRLLLLGHGEGSIYGVQQKLIEAGTTAERVQLIADIADEAAMRRIFETYHPQAIFHAAAHKHVPLMEDNPREALRVNALGTRLVASLAGEYGAERFVMISTDKAVRPSSVMGATKRIAERALTSVQTKYPATAYMTVRFGNVLGSRGSVVPLFERQIARGGPVTVTHPEMTRYFMLIPEAVSLVIQAASMGSGGELYVLDMGEPVRIVDMARTLIRLHGMEPDRDIRIEYTGVRPGEKLNEELFYDESGVVRTSHDKIFASAIRPADDIQRETETLYRSVMSDDDLRREIIALAMR